ncbi:MAG: radical SAM protein [Paludibacteraceae bacterium]|nr:radical SAM protein [Paludibacteraceae bacterium]
MAEALEAPFIGIERLRIPVDGDGVTTLVAFRDCTLACKYCLNPQSLKADARVLLYTPEKLLETVKIDNLYFLATGGGVTFGGGEPLLRSAFIEKFHDICPPEWSIYIESALNVPLEHLQRVAPFVKQFIIDIKDMDGTIYEAYTGKGNERLLNNLNWIVEQNLQDRCMIRLPRIPNFNDKQQVKASRAKLEGMGFSHFDEFNYIIRNKKA